MSTQNFDTALAKHAWRYAFRQHALDVDPTVGDEFPHSDSVASEEHWLLREPPLRSIIVSIAVDLRELGRWNGAFASLHNQALLHHSIARIGMADAVQPTTFSGHARFMAKLVLASLRELVAVKREIAAAKSQLRPRRAASAGGK